MRPPYSYYGGKTNMLPHILPLIPKHVQYVEAFFGGGALLFAKVPSKNEVINDLNANVTNFYMQLKTNFYELQKLIHGTIHSEILHTEAQKIIFEEPEKHDDLKRAWAWWVCNNLSFSFVANGGFAFGTTGMALGTRNRRDRFTDRYVKRLECVEVFNRDALDLIKLKDHPDTFFFVDPPYVSSDCGSYKGYTESDFINLLNALQNIKGKFLLTSYPEKSLLQYRDMLSVEKEGEDRGWRWQDTKQIVSINGKREDTKFKTECMTWNYPTPSHQENLFSDYTQDDFVEEEEKEFEEN